MKEFNGHAHSYLESLRRPKFLSLPKKGYFLGYSNTPKSASNGLTSSSSISKPNSSTDSFSPKSPKFKLNFPKNCNIRNNLVSNQKTREVPKTSRDNHFRLDALETKNSKRLSKSNKSTAPSTAQLDVYNTRRIKRIIQNKITDDYRPLAIPKKQKNQALLRKNLKRATKVTEKPQFTDCSDQDMLQVYFYLVRKQDKILKL
mmetsp:Transcript_4255/g.6439  ORF Transcript_4255/g.6439 Transcript_4255/m.6439 type:complete len:202 (-) Transcript_4255:22-627(-)